MYIYEVNLRLHADIYDEFLRWLPDHILEVEHIANFGKGKIGYIKDDTGLVSTNEISVQYPVRDLETLQNYFEQHALQLRQAGIDKFGNKVIAKRRIIEFSS